MSKEDFKAFARLHPELAENVINDNISWQKLYELYNIYGENSSVWNKYFVKKDSFAVNDIVNTLKKIDLNNVQSNIESIQKAIGLLQEIGIGKGAKIDTPYEARPMYKYFED